MEDVVLNRHSLAPIHRKTQLRAYTQWWMRRRHLYLDVGAVRTNTASLAFLKITWEFTIRVSNRVEVFVYVNISVAIVLLCNILYTKRAKFTTTSITYGLQDIEIVVDLRWKWYRVLIKRGRVLCLCVVERSADCCDAQQT